MSAGEKKAWNDRALMEGTLLTAQQELVSYCVEDSPGKRKVQRLLNTLHTAWGGLMNSQVSYCSAKGIEMGAAESQEYLQGQMKLYFTGKNARDDIFDSKEDQTEPDRKVQLGVDLKREILNMQIDIEGDIKGLNKLLGATTITPDGYKGAGEMVKVLEQKLSNDYKNLMI